MPLTDHRNTTQRPAVHGSECSVGKYYRAQVDNEAELVALNKHLYEYNLDAGQLMAIFTDEAVPIRRSSINKHRGRTCRCFTIDKDVCCGECRYDFGHCICEVVA